MPTMSRIRGASVACAAASLNRGESLRGPSVAWLLFRASSQFCPRMRTNTRTVPAAELVLHEPGEAFDPAASFGRAAPLEVDLGCGDGAFLVALAQQYPERNFIGIERMPGRVHSTARKIGDRALAHARVLHADILHALQDLIPPESVDVFYLMFPDPWPKRRHGSRRTFNAAFLARVARALKRGGLLRVATDDTPYFTSMQSIAMTTRDLGLEQDDAQDLPTSTFEARFRATGLAIHRFALRKV